MSKLDIQYKKGVYSYLVNWLFIYNQQKKSVG